MESMTTYHLVRSEDLNHHHTLFAGRAAEWILEAGFLSAASCLHTKNVVCAAVKDLRFIKPVHSGDTVGLESSVVRIGRSSVTVRVEMEAEGCRAAESALVFVNVDERGNAAPHGLQSADCAGEEAKK